MATRKLMWTGMSNHLKISNNINNSFTNNYHHDLNNNIIIIIIIIIIIYIYIYIFFFLNNKWQHNLISYF